MAIFAAAATLQEPGTLIIAISSPELLETVELAAGSKAAAGGGGGGGGAMLLARDSLNLYCMIS
jgi:hypothetical protein